MDSITSMKLVHQLREDIKIEVSIKDIFSYRTIRALSNHIRILSMQDEDNVQSSWDFDVYAEYNAAVTQEIFFLFPPGDGGAEAYIENFIPHLVKYHIVAFNNYYLYVQNKKKGQYETTFELLADIYIQYIKKLQPHGPYYFFGWCFGGMLAMEISRKLATFGDEIKFLGIIDAFFLEGTDFFGKEVVGLNYVPRRVSLDIMPKIENIVLFKAMKSVTFTGDAKVDEPGAIFAKHMLLAEDNYLTNILDKEEFSVIPFDGDHFTWIKDKAIVDNIVFHLDVSLSRACFNNPSRPF